MKEHGSCTDVLDVILELPQHGVFVSVRVKPLGEGRYELLEHPYITDEPQYGDVISAIEAGPHRLQFKSVIRKAGLTSKEYCVPPETFDSMPFRGILDKVMGNGGFWQRDLNCLLWVFFDPHTYDPRHEIEALLRPVGPH